MGKPMFDSRGIYIDGFSSGYTITHNICYRNSASGGIFVQGGHDIRMSNNIFADNGGPQYLHTNFMKNGANLEFTRNIVCGPDRRMALMWIYGGGEKLTRFDNNTLLASEGRHLLPRRRNLGRLAETGAGLAFGARRPAVRQPQGRRLLPPAGLAGAEAGLRADRREQDRAAAKTVFLPTSAGPWGVGGGVR